MPLAPEDSTLRHTAHLDGGKTSTEEAQSEGTQGSEGEQEGAVNSEQLLSRTGSRVIDLDIEGMTCASCVNRVERKLGKLDGVQATVNLPLESARVTVPAEITDEQLTAAVAAAGYKAKVRSPEHPEPAPAMSRLVTTRRRPQQPGSARGSSWQPCSPSRCSRSR